MKIKKLIYIEEDIAQTFKSIVAFQNKAMSPIIENLMREYNAVHEPLMEAEFARRAELKKMREESKDKPLIFVDEHGNESTNIPPNFI